jgi:hypothetical protein
MTEEHDSPPPRWLGGYYQADMDAAGGWERWLYRWKVSKRPPVGWVFFEDGYYTEERAREILRAARTSKPDNA